MSLRPIDPSIYSFIEMFEGDDFSTAEIFHESTKLNSVSWSAISTRIDSIRRNPSLIQTMKRAWKTYPGAKVVSLPEPRLGSMTVEEAFLRRRSQIGKFSGAPITAAQLSAILRFSFGPTQGGGPDNILQMHLRGSASAGGLHPTELYPLVFNVEGIPPAIYHYDVLNHALEVVSEGNCMDKLIGQGMSTEMLSSAAVVFVITGMFRRTMTKYLFRGYRFMSYDCGALTQSLYMTTTALGLGACAIGGFYDDEVGKLLGVDNVNENVLLLFTVGGKGGAGEGAASTNGDAAGDGTGAL